MHFVLKAKKLLHFIYITHRSMCVSFCSQAQNSIASLCRTDCLSAVQTGKVISNGGLFWGNENQLSGHHDKNHIKWHPCWVFNEVSFVLSSTGSQNTHQHLFANIWESASRYWVLPWVWSYTCESLKCHEYLWERETDSSDHLLLPKSRKALYWEIRLGNVPACPY